MAPRKRKNPWTSTSEVMLWLLFVALLIPAAFAGWAVGHYTSLGKPPATVTTTIAASPTTTSTPTTSSTQASTTSETTTNATAGKAVFISAGCGSCHTFTPAGSSGTLGPNLDTAPTTDAAADGNMSIEEFIRESITDPEKYIADGYSGGIMPGNFETTLTPKQLDDLAAFIASGQQ